MDGQWDAIVIGAGHNGLAAARVLAQRGRRVLVLEKNRYAGGMAGTREIFPGCRNEVGASALFPIAPEVLDFLQFERHGVEFIELPVMAINLAGPGHKPIMFYRSARRQLWHLLRHHGPAALAGFAKFAKFVAYPASVMDRFNPGCTPRSLDELLSGAPDEARREQLRLAFTGSAMDVIDRFFPDPRKHHTFRSLLAFAAIQSTYKGPYTPGSALCLVYTFAQSGDSGLMRRVKGGMGSLSEALARSIEAVGGTVRLGATVDQVLLEDGRATGVVLKGGETLRARVVLSNLDRPATFQRLVGERHLDEAIANKVAAAEHRGAWVHMLFRLDGLPAYGGEWAWLNRDVHNRFGGAMVASPEELQRSFETCDAGQLPDSMPVAFQFPSVMDPSLAPAGQHVASAYGFCFPCKAPKSERGRLRDAGRGQGHRYHLRLPARFPRAHPRPGGVFLGSLREHARRDRGRFHPWPDPSREHARRARDGAGLRAPHADRGPVDVRLRLPPGPGRHLPARLQLRAGGRSRVGVSDRACPRPPPPAREDGTTQFDIRFPAAVSKYHSPAWLVRMRKPPSCRRR